jgi:hypothetical protein
LLCGPCLPLPTSPFDAKVVVLRGRRSSALLRRAGSAPPPRALMHQRREGMHFYLSSLLRAKCINNLPILLEIEITMQSIKS